MLLLEDSGQDTRKGLPVNVFPQPRNEAALATSVPLALGLPANWAQTWELTSSSIMYDQ